jgi:hypothetical protein
MRIDDADLRRKIVMLVQEMPVMTATEQGYARLRSCAI